MAPSTSDVGLPVAVLTGADERYIYVVERSYTVNRGGGEYAVGGDGVVQLSNGGLGDPPQFISCVSDVSTPDCTEIPNAKAIYQAQSAVLTPNGENLYVASFAGIAEFKIESSGRLRYEECVGLEGGACGETRGRESPSQTVQLAMAGDGRDLYVTSEGTLTDFHVGTNGALELGECYDFSDACSSRRVGEGGFGTAVVTPNGEAVVSAFEGGNVDVYRRAGDGALTLLSCLAASGSECPSIAGPAMRSLLHPDAIAIAPNGRDIYVSGDYNAIAHLRLTDQDTLEFVGCTADFEGCESLPPTLGRAVIEGGRAGTRLAVTPDRSKLVMSGFSVLAINPSTDDLSFEGCAGSGRYCAPDHEGGGTKNLELTPNGKSAWIQEGGEAAKMELGVSPSSDGKPPPEAGALRVENVGINSADAFGSAQTHGLPTNLWFEIEEADGTVTYETGFYDNEHEIEPIQAFLSLTPGTSYRVRLVAMNAAGTSDGPWYSLKTEGCSDGEAPTSNEWPNVFTSATSIVLIGLVNPRCHATTLKLEVGTTEAYGKAFTVPKSRTFDGDWAEDYFIEASGLAMNTTYYYRLVAHNARGTAVLAKGVRTTAPAEPPAAQVSAQTGSARRGREKTTIVEGTLIAGGTPASVEAQVFESPDARNEPSQTFALGQYPADTRAITVSGPLTGLTCVRHQKYEWLLAAHTPYGESLGVRKPLHVSCR